MALTSTHWSLAELVGEPREINSRKRLDLTQTRIEELERARPELSSAIAASRLAELLALYEQIVEDIRTLSSDGVLWVAEDTRVQEAQSYRNRLQQALTALHNRALFIESWWKDLDQEDADRLLSELDNADYVRFLGRLRALKPYDLAEDVEQAVNLLKTYSKDFSVSLWSMLNNRLVFSVEIDGEKRDLSRAEALNLAFSPRPELRRAAYQEMGRVYGQESKILGRIYINVAQNWHAEMMKLRGYASPIEARHVSNELPSEIVDSLFNAIRNKKDIFYRYFAAKARHLGHQRLHRYDLYAPWGISDREVSYTESIEIIRESFASFDTLFLQKLNQIIDQKHIDSDLRPGKWSGDFCSTVVPSLTPWVLVNYNSRIRDVPKLAHEIGHAVHSMLASDHSVFTQQPGLPLGETASIFCELLVLETMLRGEQNTTARLDLIGAWADSAYAAVVRQAYFVFFEIEAHRLARSSSSVEDLEMLYMEKLREQFGDEVELTDEFRGEWMGIHQLFHSPFYCYAYSFGHLIALSLYQLYQEDRESFKYRYFKLLAWGGAASVQAILQEFGIDMAADDFWSRGLYVVEEYVKELEALEGGAYQDQEGVRDEPVLHRP